MEPNTPIPSGAERREEQPEPFRQELETVETKKRRISHFIDEHPLLTVASAAALGVVLGRLSRQMSAAMVASAAATMMHGAASGARGVASGARGVASTARERIANRRRRHSNR